MKKRIFRVLTILTGALAGTFAIWLTVTHDENYLALAFIISGGFTTLGAMTVDVVLSCNGGNSYTEPRANWGWDKRIEDK